MDIGKKYFYFFMAAFPKTKASSNEIILLIYRVFNRTWIEPEIKIVSRQARSLYKIKKEPLI